MNTESELRIRTDEAIELFESKAALAKALNIKPQAITGWGEFVPQLRAFQLREMFPNEFGREGAEASRAA